MPEEQPLSEDSPADDALAAIADALNEAPSAETPIEPWVAGGSLSYQVVKPRLRASVEERAQRIATASLMTGIACAFIVLAMLFVGALGISEDLYNGLGAGALLAMLATLYLASLASRDNADFRTVLMARILAFLWMPISLGVAVHLGADGGSLICLAFAFAGIAGFLLIAMVIAREVISACF